MTLSPPLNDECYGSSLIEDPVCLDIDDGSLQLEHWPHSLLVTKYTCLDYDINTGSLETCNMSHSLFHIFGKC